MAVNKTRSLLLPVAALAAVMAVTSVGLTARQPLLRGLLSNDLVGQLRRAPRMPNRVILQGDVASMLEAAARHGIPVHQSLDRFIVVSATASQVAALQLEPAIRMLFSDLPVVSTMTVSDRTLAADQARAGTSGLLLGIGGFPGVTGRGVGVAVVDSGISAHRALANKVKAAVSFVADDPNVDDAFGHGTHIAGIITGNSAAASRVTTQYAGGVARGAHLVNVRVLGADGTGLTSGVVAGLDWVIANHKRYGIRVVNLSLGHPVQAPCVFDPLCSSVQRVVEAGIVVVASAGNRGKTADGHTVLGGVTSPGNSPYALTVGALNTWGTVARSDDTVTTYSSRGPTAYDFGVKPDVVAPGNKVVSLEAPSGYISTNYPMLHVAGSGANGYSQMSGTSMAAGMMSGGVAMLLEAVPSMTPAHVKVALQTTSSYMVDDGLMAAGAGSVNLWSARRAGGSTLLSLLPTSLIGGLVARPGGVAFFDAGTLATRLHQGTGLRLLGVLEALLGLSDPSSLEWGQLNLVGAQNPVASVPPNQIIWGDQIFDAHGQQIIWSDQIIWGDQIFDSEGQQIIWSDGEMDEGQQIIWSDSTISGDERR